MGPEMEQTDTHTSAIANQSNTVSGGRCALRVLLVEDNPGDARLIQEYLHHAIGAFFDMVHAECLTAARELLRCEQFDAVLLDLGLPESQGLDTLRAMRASATGIAVVVLTGLADEQLGSEAVQYGAQDYLVKGEVNEAILSRTLCYAVERVRLNGRVEQQARELQAGEARLRKLVELSVDGIVVVGEAGDIRFINGAGAALFGRSAAQLTGRPFGFPVATGEVAEFEVSRGGDTRVVEMRVAHLEWEGEPACLASLRDTTERKQAEQALQCAKEELENRVQERTLELKQTNERLLEDIVARRRLEDTLYDREARLKAQQQALLNLAKDVNLNSGDLSQALHTLTETAAHTLDVERVSVWLFDESRRRIACQDLYERITDGHMWDQELSAEEYPAYFKALDEDRVIAAHDAHRDPRTREFSGPYLSRLGITSLLDAPIRVDGKTVGVVCHEHIGDAREWTLDEQTFAGSIADMAALALERAERRRADDKLRLAAKVFESTKEGIIIADAEGSIQFVNPAFTDITGYGLDEVVGKNPRLLQSDRQDAKFHRRMWTRLVRDGHWEGEIWNRHKNGQAYAEWQTISVIRDEHGRVSHYVSIFHDISERVRREEEIRHQAYHDPLTGLPNRQLFIDRLRLASAQAQRRDKRLAVLFIDLDRFKEINDTLGHQAGDELLITVAQRMTRCIREADTLARLGGDEFTVLLPDVMRMDDVCKTARRIVASLETPQRINGQRVQISTSIGIAIYPDDGLDADTLLANADAAMYRAKKRGRNRFEFYSEVKTRLVLRSGT